MRFLRRYLLLLFALAMSLNLFSITALADSETGNYKVHIVAYNSAFNILSQQSFYDGDDTAKGDSASSTLKDQNYYLKHELTFTDESDYILFEGGKNYDFRADNLYFVWMLQNTNREVIWEDSRNMYLANGRFIYADGTTENIELELTYNNSTDSFSISTSVSPSADVAKMYVDVVYLLQPSKVSYLKLLIGNSIYCATTFGAEPFVSDGLKIEISVDSKETGLLKGVLGKITDLWKTAESGFANMVKGITDLQQNILDLPSKLWELISNGLKALFVPDPEYMTSYKDKWDQLLAKQLGAVYQVKEILTESWDSVMAADIQNSIEFPSATINLPGGNSFTFGGYTVQVVPNGFTVLTTAIKTIIGIVCTIAFVNGMRKRYDEIMGVEQ